MAGHSHWQNIRYIKEAEDRRRMKIFARLSRELISAARGFDSEADAAKSPRVMAIIDRAKGSNMPKELIVRALQKATSGGPESGEIVPYECRGAGGVIIAVICCTDNKNRSKHTLRTLARDLGSDLTSSSGQLPFAFEQRGLIVLEKNGVAFPDQDELAVMDLAACVEAEDYERDPDDDLLWNIFTARQNFAPAIAKMNEVLTSDFKILTEESKLKIFPKEISLVDCSLEDYSKNLELFEKLGEFEDAVEIAHNMNLQVARD